MMMDFSFRLLGEIARWQSLTVKRAFFDVGSFRLVTDNTGSAAALARGMLLFFPDEQKKMLLVEKTIRKRGVLTADGWMLKGLAKRRLCVPPSIPVEADQYQAFGWDRFTGNAESAYLHYAANNLTAPEDGKRAIPGLVLAENLGRGPVLPWQARFDKLNELFESIGEGTGLGWDIWPDFSGRQFVFGAWEGIDRTTGLKRAVLSPQMGNVDEYTVTDDGSNEVSTVYAGGAGEDENRLILSIGNEAAGLGRREGWADVSGVSDADMLRLGAKRKLSPAKLTLGVDVRETGLCRYGRDYDVGDLVVVAADGWQMNARLIAMEEAHEHGARTLRATFGDAPVTFTGLLRENQRQTVR